MHFFVTGGTGFFGKALLRYWGSKNLPEIATAKFTFLSRNPGKFKETHGNLLSGLNTRFVAGNILQPETLPIDEYTHVLHAATDSTEGIALTPLQRFSQIVDGTRNVLELAVRSGRPRVLLTSSGGVYGEISQFMEGVPEDYNGMPDPLVPHNAYSLAKRQAEHLCALYRHTHGLDYVIARCFTFVGEDLPLNAHFAAGNFIRDVLEGRDILIQGNGTQIRSYLDQRDLARWLTVILLGGISQRAYNVGSSEGITISDLANKIAEFAPRKKTHVRILNGTQTGQAQLRSYYLPSTHRITNELNLSMNYNLDDAILATISAHQGRIENYHERNKKY